MLPYFWVAETGPWPRELEMIYFVPNSVRPRNPCACPTCSEIHRSIRNFPIAWPQVNFYDLDQEPGNASLDSFSILSIHIPSHFLALQLHL